MEGAAVLGTMWAHGRHRLAPERSGREMQKRLMLPGKAGTPCWIYGGSDGEGGCILAHCRCQCLRGNQSRGLQWYPSTIWPRWHSCCCLQGWLWIMSFSDQRPEFWMQAWSVCYINSFHSFPNGSHSRRFLRASEELQMVVPHGEMTPPSFLTRGVLTHPVLLMLCLERACFREDGPLFLVTLNIRREIWLGFPQHSVEP